MATAALSLPARSLDAERYKNRYIIAMTVSLASVLELLDTSIVNVAIPHMMGNLGATLDEIAWVSTGYIVANVIVLPITGWLSAYFGRRRYFAGSIALFTIASFFCGNAHSLLALVFWRVVQGLGGGALLSTSQAILYEEFPREEYGTAMAIFGVGVMVGPTLGPTLGGYITDAFSWPWIFYINIPFGIIALGLTLSYIQNSRFQQRVAQVDYVGLVLLAAGIGTLQTMLERGERLDWFQAREVVLLALISGASLVAFVWHELTTEHPVVDLRILKSRQLAVGVVFGGVLGVCLYATVFVLPVYLQNLQNFTAQQTGFVILPGALASAFTMAAMGRFTGKFDARLSILAGVSIFALSMWKHGHYTTDSGMADFFWPLIFRGVGLGLIFVPLTNLALADLPMSKIPNGTGLFNLMRQLGGSVGIAISATLLQRFATINRAELAAKVTQFSPVARQQLDQIATTLIANGAPPPVAQTKALAILNGIVTKQAMMLSFEHLFLLFGACFVASLPLLLLMHRSRGMPGAGAAAH
ncbi:MAG TPA: DHA2 family efflux MFS transporter permease subunit [Gemmatimonadales bacterium]|nr:DHA2 family efflux MFS transporter permease subunit [Gemmatimonadales bacterium]